MASSFDPEDKSSWYFGPITRQDATDLLLAERESGVFLIRDSASSVGDFVLCVKEDSKVSHYIINRTAQHTNQESGGKDTVVRYRIGAQQFPDLPGLLAFYKIHYLDTAPLIRPATKRTERVVGKYDFEGQDTDDLPFRKGEVLIIVCKDEEQWWTAVNADGRRGSIPVPYVERLDDRSANAIPVVATTAPASTAVVAPVPPTVKRTTTQIARRLPAPARVKQVRIPNAYDKTALKLQVGDIINVTKTNINGQWEGELNGKTGHFPFTHVEFIEVGECTPTPSTPTTDIANDVTQSDNTQTS